MPQNMFEVCPIFQQSKCSTSYLYISITAKGFGKPILVFVIDPCVCYDFQTGVQISDIDVGPSIHRYIQHIISKHTE